MNPVRPFNERFYVSCGYAVAHKAIIVRKSVCSGGLTG